MSDLDEIAVTGIRAFGRHGVYPEERRDGQEFVADVVLFLSLAAAARSDDVADTVHYGELAEEIAAILAGDPVDLLETLASRIADTVLARDLVQRVRVTVHKPAAPIPVPFGDVSVTVTRGRMP
ncbi:dihydroneopterin aldolase [Microbacterium sp. zg.Y1090]|uniref:dihydroneopterin aldolase n=1 Tax=Microbacterium TaxID=33882 RepID=UPI00214CF3C5|nr:MULTISPECIES: dihydroneopterin aldolase [unclassified Microbacterium]MCR2813911.1 dihydroneopterin aldolase [Microbacterium sp. zg.Y1084]MCR2819185.1 dihydroneopterin aldolase [Microbacterium sp. zg.Y1090]MDL5487094.1 dihydroneopterin aldolase [Microbacterium sp. zg-Y1211]WIM28169.1 dihydroneopterin aldolase [Microbacterium sp. zg-Y1090]